MGCLLILGCTVKRGQIQVEKDVKTFFYTHFFAYCGETSAWSGTCAKFNPRNLAPLKRHARLWSASFGWHVLQRKSYTRPSYAPKTLEPKAKALQVLAQKPFAQKPPKVRVSAIALLTQLASGGRLQTVANGCKRLRTQKQRRANTGTP